VAGRVLDVDDVETTGVSLSGLDGTDSPDVLTADDLADVTGLELDPVGDFGGLDVELDAVANPYIGVGVSEGSSVVCDEKGNVVLGSLDLLDSAELVGGLLSADSVYHESAFGVVDESKVLVGLVNSDDIHESSGVLDISPDLAVNLDHTAHHDLLALLAAESVVQAVSDENGQRKAFSELVRASIGSERVDATGLAQHPVVRCRKGLQMLLRSPTSHRVFFGFLLVFCKFDLRL